MNGEKICFITCVNNQELYKETLHYINQLEVPSGYGIECISIENAESMTQGYNKAMKTSDAKYKVYLHQDVFIINKFFIRDIINIFKSDNKIGLIGMVGAKIIPTNGIWWESNHKYGKVYDSHTGEMKLLEFENIINKYEDVQGVDGLIMVTQYDVPWREDRFDGWYFYDLSQSIEFKKSGYKVVIPKQEEAWIVHDCGIVNVKNRYEEYRELFLEEYSKDIFPLVSILIPTYNRPEYFTLALESALNQTYKNIEIIIGDDSTNNETKKLIKDKYLKEYSNIIYFHNEKNLGQFDNDLKLYDLSKGEYINYLMDDDLFEITKIEKMMNYFIQDVEDEISLVTSHRRMIDDYGNKKAIFGNTENIFSEDTILSGIEMSEIMLRYNHNFIGEPTTVLFKKNKLTEPFGILNGRKYGCNVDQASWYNLLTDSKGVFINEVLSYFRIHKGQQQKDFKIEIKGFTDYLHSILICREKGYLLDENKYLDAVETCLEISDSHIIKKYEGRNLDIPEYKEFEKYYLKLKSIIDNNIKQPNILITNSHLVNYAGSELVTFRLAEEFIYRGYNVTVATFKYGSPIKELFEKKHIKVCNVLSDEIKNTKFSVIWAQHFTTIDKVLMSRNITADKIIINSMSPFEPLEAPPVYSNLLSLNVVNSKETSKKITSEGIEEKNIYIMPNPVENEFVAKYDRTRGPGLYNMCVVSNHVPKEIYKTSEILKSKGINVDIFGINDTFTLITSDILKKYDAIITIGKTVQYGMILGIPVYCYDRFGGPGWINVNNFTKAYEYNFSGRCCNRKLKEEKIASEILLGYEEAFKEREIFYKFAQSNFIMSEHINNILEIVDKKENVNINLIKSKYGMLTRQNAL